MDGRKRPWWDYADNQLNSEKVATEKLFKELWAGNWTSGSINVPNLSQYKLFALVSTPFPVTLIGIRWGNDIIAHGIDINASNGQRTFGLACGVSGNTLTNLRTSVLMNFYNGQNHVKEAFPVTHIYGIL